jgi:hypothetical protein
MKQGRKEEQQGRPIDLVMAGAFFFTQHLLQYNQ